MDAAFTQSVERLVALAREEDLGRGDITTALMADADQPATFSLLARQSCVFAGRAMVPVVLGAYDTAIELCWNDGAQDGDAIDIERPSDADGTPQGQGRVVELGKITGSLRSILAAERVLLNFLQRLCGIATLTWRYVDAVEGTSAVICDTRKTTPGWRLLEKYAVRCGGGTNHRVGLYDGVLIKDNHLSGIPTARLAGAVFEMLSRLAEPDGPSPDGRVFVEVEVDTFDQLEALLSVVGIDAILLDNFALDTLREAVALRDGLGLAGKVLLEASGGITLDTVRSVAQTGVDRISVGAITHSAIAVDLALERTR